MLPPRFARDETELETLGRDARRWSCPHCRRSGELNRHGWLRGVSETGVGKASRRGQRFFCSDRGRRRGCGRTFSVWLATVIAGATVRSGTLWQFLAARLGGSSVLAAWLITRSGFSLEAGHRWWRQWRRGECVLRARLWRGREPPETSLAATCAARYGADAIAGFQHREQTGWPGFAS